MRTMSAEDYGGIEVKNLQKNEDILTVERPSENRQPKNRWELFDITFDWFNESTRYPVEIAGFLDSDAWNYRDRKNDDAVYLFDLIFDYLNDVIPFAMREFMCNSPEYQVILEVIGEDV